MPGLPGQPSAAPSVEGQLLLVASAAGPDSSQQSPLVARGAATSGVPQMDDDLRRAIEMSLQEDPRPDDQDAAAPQDQVWSPVAFFRP